MPPRDSLIVALDVADSSSAREIVYELGDNVDFYKIGLQLFAAEGSALVRELVASGQRIFLDLKFHDIPNTVASAVRSAAALGVEMLTVHAAGGLPMLKAAVEAAKGCAKPPLILAVTVLTSLSQDDLGSTGITAAIADHVLRLAALAKEAGCGGVVASPHEVAALRKALGSKMMIVVPGIRPAGSAAGDQVRTAGPAQAIQAGASYLVIGRPITEAADKNAALQAILKEISSGV